MIAVHLCSLSDRTPQWVVWIRFVERDVMLVRHIFLSLF